jgi:hypothetical protein
MFRPFLAAALSLLAACEFTPNHVASRDIDDALINGRYKTVCKGLEMKDDKVREYATEKLVEVQEPIAAECICKFLPGQEFVPGTDGWDPAIARGLTGTDRDELATCFADLVARPDLPRRLEAVSTLARIPARAARDALANVATSPGEADQRAAALKAIAADPVYKDRILGLLSGEPDPAVRAAAATGLGGLKDDVTVNALVAAATGDKDGVVRGAALVAVRQSGHPAADEMACKAMMEDESPDVRRAAVMSFQGTKRKEPIACLRARALAFEEDSSVREAMLTVLKSSPSDDAALILCDAIPFWMKSYVKEEIPEKLPGTMIVKAQNDRDWERSYACVQRAVGQGGYSCFARMHLGNWFRELGGNTHVPECPGYEAKKP